MQKRASPKEPDDRPVCATCSVGMWLDGWDDQSNPAVNLLHYKCPSCDTRQNVLTDRWTGDPIDI